MKEAERLKKYKSFIPILTFTFFIGTSTLFAQSINHITKVVTVGQNTQLSSEEDAVKAPSLVMNLSDGLHEGDRFYLHLSDATWQLGELTLHQRFDSDEPSEVVEEVIGKVLSPTEMEVIVTKGEIDRKSVV